MKTYYQTTPVTWERVERLLESYGASPEAWPAEEREAALALLVDSDHLQRVQQETLTLDKALGAGDKHGSEGNSPDPILVKRILDNLPEQDSAEPAVVVVPESQPPRLDVSAWFDRILGWPGLALAGTAVAVLFVASSSQPSR